MRNKSSLGQTMPSRGTNRLNLDSMDLGDYDGAFIHKFKLTSAVKPPKLASPQVIKVRQLLDAAAEEEDQDEPALPDTSYMQTATPAKKRQTPRQGSSFALRKSQIDFNVPPNPPQPPDSPATTIT